MPELDRAADPVRGKAIYGECLSRLSQHRWLRIRRSLPTTDLGYGAAAVGLGQANDGAGMARLITAANFVHFNMPHGTDYLNPQLTVEQAWDVAAYDLSTASDKSGPRIRIFPTSNQARRCAPTARTPTDLISSNTCTDHSLRSGRARQNSEAMCPGKAPK